MDVEVRTSNVGFTINDEQVEISEETLTINWPRFHPRSKIKAVNGNPILAKSDFYQSVQGLTSFKITVAIPMVVSKDKSPGDQCIHNSSLTQGSIVTVSEVDVVADGRVRGKLKDPTGKEEVRVCRGEDGGLGFTINGENMTITRVDSEFLQRPRLYLGSKIKEVNAKPVSSKSEFDLAVVGLMDFRITVETPGWISIQANNCSYQGTTCFAAKQVGDDAAEEKQLYYLLWIESQLKESLRYKKFVRLLPRSCKTVIPGQSSFEEDLKTYRARPRIRRAIGSILLMMCEQDEDDSQGEYVMIVDSTPIGSARQGGNQEVFQIGQSVLCRDDPLQPWVPGVVKSVSPSLTVDLENWDGAPLKLREVVPADKVATLNKGTEVEVIEVVTFPDERRIRAKLRSPSGWIFVLNTDTCKRWAMKSAQASLLKNFGLPVSLNGWDRLKKMLATSREDVVLAESHSRRRSRSRRRIGGY